MYREHTIGVVVPAYNESELIEETLASIPEYVDTVYAVDDAVEVAGAKVVSHGVNKGNGSAVKTSLGYAAEHGFDALVLLADVPKTYGRIWTGCYI